MAHICSAWVPFLHQLYPCRQAALFPSSYILLAISPASLLKIDVVLESMLYQLHYGTAKSLILICNISTEWLVTLAHKRIGHGSRFVSYAYWPISIKLHTARGMRKQMCLADRKFFLRKNLALSKFAVFQTRTLKFWSWLKNIYLVIAVLPNPWLHVRLMVKSAMACVEFN